MKMYDLGKNKDLWFSSENPTRCGFDVCDRWRCEGESSWSDRTARVEVVGRQITVTKKGDKSFSTKVSLTIYEYEGIRQLWEASLKRRRRANDVKNSLFEENVFNRSVDLNFRNVFGRQLHCALYSISFILRYTRWQSSSPLTTLSTSQHRNISSPSTSREPYLSKLSIDIHKCCDAIWFAISAVKILELKEIIWIRLHQVVVELRILSLKPYRI